MVSSHVLYTQPSIIYLQVKNLTVLRCVPLIFINKFLLTFYRIAVTNLNECYYVNEVIHHGQYCKSTLIVLDKYRFYQNTHTTFYKGEQL